MKHYSSYVWFFWLMVLALLFRGSLSIDSRIRIRDTSFKSGFIAASASTEQDVDQNNRRGLTAEISSTKVSNIDGDDSTISPASNDSNKGSIASRTSSMVTTKDYSSDISESMGIHFVQPETGAPSITPLMPTKNWTTKSSASTLSTITPSSTVAPETKASGTVPVSSPTMKIATTTGTKHPTVANSQSFASRTSTMDEETRVPLSAAMEFDKAETTPPSTLKLISNSTKNNNTESLSTFTSVSSVDDDKTEGDNHLTFSDINLTNNDSRPTASTTNSTSSSSPLLFLKEKSQPNQWPEIVSIIFIVMAIVFFSMTASRNYGKRKDYQKLPN